ncbi:MAG: hypothetical protein KAY24_04950 [Candidatus Eisenbacteria sp.]|nr:hypothetical protein [Candidatus Eisenbacteria bacterium]
MIAREMIALAFAVGSLDFLAFHLYRTRLRNAFLGFLRLRLLFILWSVMAGVLAAIVYFVVMVIGSLALGIDTTAGRLPWIAAVLVPLAFHHAALSWPGSNRFNAPDQRNRVLYVYRPIWDVVGRYFEDCYSRSLEQLANDYAGVPWDEGSLARIHARIVPHYRLKEKRQRVNPQLLVALKKFRAQEDVFSFFYAILDEFGPRAVAGLMSRL